MPPKTEKPVHPRKIEILHAAITCFLDRGYHQTGVRDIAKQAGISLGNLYNHFKGKEAVLAFIAEIDGRELSGFVADLSEPADPCAALEQFIVEYTAYASRPENALLGVEILTEALRNPNIAAIFGKDRGQLIGAIADCLKAGATSGVFRSYDDERAVACTILDALEGHGLRSLSKNLRMDRSTASLHKYLMNGLKP